MGERDRGEVADHHRRPRAPAEAARFRIGPGVAGPGRQVAATEHEAGRARAEMRRETLGNVEYDGELAQLQVVGILEVGWRVGVRGDGIGLPRKRRRGIVAIAADGIPAPQLRGLIE